MCCTAGDDLNDLLKSAVLPERPSDRQRQRERKRERGPTQKERERERDRESVANGGPLSQPKAVLVDAWGARAQEHENPNVRKKPSPV